MDVGYVMPCGPAETPKLWYLFVFTERTLVELPGLAVFAVHQ